MSARSIAVLAGAYGLAMALGAVFFQFVIGVAPCEMCYWQRYPHFAAAVIGLIGALACKDRSKAVAILALACVAASGLIGAYHSGVEWRIFPGPTSCTGDRVIMTSSMDLNVAPVVRCDIVTWRFFGLFSLANLNAIFSLGAAALGGIGLACPTLAARLIGKKA